MERTAKQQKILNFLKKQLLCVVATIDAQGKPEAATVAFSEDDTLELCIGTRADTRKYKNLQRNKYIALVIGVDHEQKTSVQYEGEATQVKSKELDQYRQQHLTKNPGSRKFADDPQQRYFRISPRWIRYTDYEQRPPLIFELKFHDQKGKAKKIQ